MNGPKKSLKDDVEVLSYKEFAILFISGPTIFILMSVLSALKSDILTTVHIVQTTFALQGTIAMFFVFRRNPDFEKRLKIMDPTTSPIFYQYIVRFFIVVATTVGSIILFGVPFYLLFS
jgi:hypothetical protein